MKLKDLLKRVATGVFTELVPGGGIIVDLINDSLPDGVERLKASSTGVELERVLDSLPIDARDEIAAAAIDLKVVTIKEEGATVRAMLLHDAKNPQSTRPYIAKQSFHVIALVSLSVVGVLIYAVANDPEPMGALTQCWPLILSILAPLVFVLRRYFGALSDEQSTKLNSANGFDNKSALTQLIGALRK